MAGRKDLTNQLDGLFSEFEPGPEPVGEKGETSDAFAGLIEGQADVEPVAVAEEEQARADEVSVDEPSAEELPSDALSFGMEAPAETAVAESAMDGLLGAEPDIEQARDVQSDVESEVLAEIVAVDHVPAVEEPVVTQVEPEAVLEVGAVELAATEVEAALEAVEVETETAAPSAAETLVDMPVAEAPAVEEMVWEPPVIAEAELAPAEVEAEIPSAEVPSALSAEAPSVDEMVWESPVIAEAEPVPAEVEAEIPSAEVPSALSAEAPSVDEMVRESPIIAEAELAAAPPESVEEVWEPPAGEPVEPEADVLSADVLSADVSSALSKGALSIEELAVIESVWGKPHAEPTVAETEAGVPSAPPMDEPAAEPPSVTETAWEEPVVPETAPPMAAPDAVEMAWDTTAFEPAPSEESAAEPPTVAETGWEELVVPETAPPMAAPDAVETAWEEFVVAEPEPTATATEAAELDWEIPAFEQAAAEADEALGGEQVWEEPATGPVAAEAIWETPIVAEPDTEGPVWDESVVAEVVAEVVERDTREGPVDEALGEVLSVADLAAAEPELAEAAAAVLPVELPSVEVPPTDVVPADLASALSVGRPIVEEPAAAEPVLVEAEAEPSFGEEPVTEEPAIAEPASAEVDAGVLPVGLPSVDATSVDKSTIKLPSLEAPRVATPSESPAAAEPTAPAWEAFLEGERLKILNILLGIVSVASTALVIDFVIKVIRHPSELGSHIPYFAAYIILLVVTFLRQLPWKLRAGVPVGLFYAVGIASTLNRGVLGPADLYLVVAPLVVAVLFGHREGAISALGSALLYGGLAFAQNRGWLQPDPALLYNLADPSSVYNLVVSFIMLAAVAALMLWRSRSGLIGALRDAEERRAETALSQALLRERAEELADTNVLLEKRSLQLETASELAHSAVAELDLGEWMQQAVDLICQRFDLYHVGLYLLDEDGSRAVMMAGTGDTGRQMLAQDFGCQVGGGSAIGRSVAEAQPYIAREASDAVGQPGYGVGRVTDFGEIRSLLPLTRSEIALPLQSHGQMLGALDAHSTVQGAFPEEEIAALHTLADQMAVAIHDAKLFIELRQRLQELEAAQRLYVRKQFADFAARQGAPFHQRTRPGTTPLVDAVPPEVENAMAQGKMVVQPGTGDGAKEAALVAPIQLRGEIIGALGLQEIADGRSWTQDEIALVEAVADQMALAIENIRLLDETRQRAQRDRLIADITAQVRASMDVERILQTAVRGLGTALGTNRAYIRLSAPSSEDGGTRPLDVEALPGVSGGNGRTDEEKDQGGEEPSAESVSPMQDEPVTDEASTNTL